MPDTLIDGRFARRVPTAALGPNPGELLPFPPPDGDAHMALADYFSAKVIEEITAHGSLAFHAVGDSGTGTPEQTEVADAMAKDVDGSNHAASPAFLLHLGDIIYGPDKMATYATRFYRPNDSYPNLIFAIPGNHDGEMRSSQDTASLQAFLANFCQPKGQQPPMAVQFGRTMPNQPGAYWRLTGPFVDIVGLYSNTGENFGAIADPAIGDGQKTWLTATLTAIAAERAAGTRRALVLAVHHPPFASGLQQLVTEHPGNPVMLADIDDCCKQAGLWPDAVLSAHAHSYQHYERTVDVGGASRTIPYIIAGGGGISPQRAPSPVGVTKGDVTYKNGVSDHGYITVTVSKDRLQIDSTVVIEGHRQPFETLSVALS